MLTSRVQVFGVDSHVLFRLCGAKSAGMHRVRLASCAFLSPNRRREVRESLQFGDHPKADDRVGKSIDLTANSQFGGIAEMASSVRVG